MQLVHAYTDPGVATVSVIVRRGRGVCTTSGSTGAVGALPHRSPDLAVSFDIATLHRLRTLVAEACPAEPLVLDRILTVATELATNAIRHGGGRGRLLLWVEADAVRLRVGDGGLGPVLATPPTAPPPEAVGGRGLWLCTVLSEEFRTVATGADRVVKAVFRLDRA